MLSSGGTLVDGTSILTTRCRYAKDRTLMNLRQLVERGDRPFASQPQVGRYFPAASIEDARRRLGRAIERCEGPGVVIGSAGSGKSLLLQVLATQYRERFDVVLLACTQVCTRRALLQAIHFELGLDYRRRDEGQLRLSLLDQLLASDSATEGLLLLVDEAQSLSANLLEELRVLTNLARGGLPRVRLVLAGLPSLEEMLASPELESFSQRLATRCYIGPFTRGETSQYVRAQLAASSVDVQQVFAAPALNAVFNATDGVPRLVNQLCDRSLLLAVTRNLSQVDETVVQAAWADLQQLPTPWETPRDDASPSTAESGVVEFGNLDAVTAVEESPTAAAEELAPRPELAESPSLTFDVARLASRMASMPLLNAESDADEPSEATELDEEVLASSPTTASKPSPRPRVFSEQVPDAVDPFADPFEEEELVLDNFAAISGLFGTRTPRVENRRDPSFSRFVERVMETAPTPAAQPKSGSRDPADSKAERASERGPERPRIRLAVVSESSHPGQRPVEPRVQNVVAEAEELDFDPPPSEMTKAYRQLFSRDAERPESIAKSSTPIPATRPSEAVEVPHETDPTILVIEDDPASAHSPSGVRRESYRQLFSRLRQGA